MGEELDFKLELDVLDTSSDMNLNPFPLIPGLSEEKGYSNLDIPTLKNDVPSLYNFRNNLIQMTLLGRGASAFVYKSLHVPSLRLVAQKIIQVYDESKRHQMLRELKTLNQNLVPITEVKSNEQTFSPCRDIVSFYEAFSNPSDGTVNMIVEYMDGGSLQDFIDTGGCDDENVLANVAYRILRGLKFLHDHKQIHRDIKPANLLISHTGEVKISDFGIVREIADSNSFADTFVGTYTYMSPERIAGRPYSYNADVWSLGMSVLACGLGRYPFDESLGYWGLLQALRDHDVPLPNEDGKFSEDFLDFIRQCLIRDPELRPTASILLSHPFILNRASEPQHEEEITVRSISKCIHHIIV